jgi:hypothetical protein
MPANHGMPLVSSRHMFILEVALSFVVVHPCICEYRACMQQLATSLQYMLCCCIFASIQFADAALHVNAAHTDMLCDLEACKYTAAAVSMHLTFDAKQQTLQLICIQATVQVLKLFINKTCIHTHHKQK